MEFEDLIKVGKTTNYSLINIRGLVGDFVFRKLKSGTYISRRPKKPSTQTEGQRRGRERFRLATEFAKKEMLNPSRKAYYLEIVATDPPRFRNAYTAAIQDYMSRSETVLPKTKPSALLQGPPHVLKRSTSLLQTRREHYRCPIKRQNKFYEILLLPLRHRTLAATIAPSVHPQSMIT